MSLKKPLRSVVLLGVALSCAAFTYQGRLQDAGQPAGGKYDFRFTLYDAPAAGTVLGVVVQTNVPVVNGLFAVDLEFQANLFNGEARWLEIAAGTNGAAGLATLSPRQSITPTPYAIYAPSAGIAQSAASAAALTGPLTGNGSGITNINAATLSGTVLDGRLSTNVLMRDRLSPVLSLLEDTNNIFVFEGDSQTARPWPTMAMTNRFFAGRYLLWTNFAGDGDGIGSNALPSAASIFVSNGVASVTYPAHGLYTLLKICVQSVQTPALNGLYKITVLDNNSFTFPITAPDGTSCSDAHISYGISARYPNFVRPLKPAPGQTGWLFLYEGANDIGVVYQTGGASTNAGFGYWSGPYSNYVWQAHQDGWRVACFTLPPTYGVFPPGTERDLCRKMMSDWIRGNGPQCDMIIDIEPIFSNPYDSRFIFSDLLHLTPESCQRLAGIVSDRMLSGSYATVAGTPYIYNVLQAADGIGWTNAVTADIQVLTALPNTFSTLHFTNGILRAVTTP